MEDSERLKVVQDYRTAVFDMIEAMQKRLTVSDKAEAFSPAMVMSGLAYAGLHYVMSRGLTPPQFIAAIRAMANQLEVEWTTKSGMFAPPPNA